MDKLYYTEDELIQGYAAMAEINQNLSQDAFKAEVEAEFIIYANL